MTSTLKTLQHLLDDDMCRFIASEIQLKEALEDWIQTATSLKLKTILEKYVDLVSAHIAATNNFLMEENASSLSLRNPIMEAMIHETNEKLHRCSDAPIKDACLLACIQTINHFKIAAYGTAFAYANAMQLTKAASIFREAEINEKQIDDRLSQLAEYEINERARTSMLLPV